MKADPDTRILVVDDFATMAEIIQALLRQAGYSNIDLATDAEAALAMLREGQYDVVISDWHMQPRGGLDLLREMNSDENLQRVAFVMMSGDAAASNACEARAEGAADYIVKPFDAGMLRERIGVAMAA